MKLVIMEHLSHLPGNATWSVMPLPPHSRTEIFELMGHKVVDVVDEEAERIIKTFGQSIMLQVELRDLFYKDEDIKAAPKADFNVPALKAIVNGKEIDIPPGPPMPITYEQILIISGETMGASCTYRSKTSSGILSQGQSVILEDGMIFNCIHTGNA